MKRSKKLLMVLGISGALAATALTITTTTLLSKNVANDNVTPANQNTDFSILNKHKYSEKLNEVETLLHNDLKHNKYQDIRSELDNSKDEISKTITNESNEVDYTNAINSLQEAIDKALNKKAKADKKLLELSEYENTYLSRVEIKRIKALRDNLIAEKEAINNAIYNQELKTQSLYDNAIEKLDDLLYNTKEKEEVIVKELSKIQWIKNRIENLLAELKNANKDYYNELISEIEAHLSSEYTVEKINEALEPKDPSDFSELFKPTADRIFQNKKDYIDILQENKERYNSKVLEVEGYLNVDLNEEKYNAVKEKLTTELERIKNEVQSSTLTDIQEKTNFYNQKIQELEEALQKARGGKDDIDAETNPRIQYNRKLAEFENLISRFKATKGTIRAHIYNKGKIIKELETTRDEVKQSVANTTPENETQLYTEAKAKIVKSIEDTLAKRSELIKSNIRTNFEDLKNSWENEINSRLESGEIDRNQLSDSIFKKYENLVKLVNSEEYLDQKISLDNNETEISKWYSAMTESILFLEEIRDNDPYDYYLEKEREEEILTKLEEAEQLISQLNDDKYQDIKTRLEEKINLNKNRYQTSKQNYISSQNKEITQVNQLTTIYQTILSDLTRALDEANNEKNTVDNN